LGSYRPKEKGNVTKIKRDFLVLASCLMRSILLGEEESAIPTNVAPKYK
jgi:hypothetical protein